jgi:hypothetical protein
VIDSLPVPVVYASHPHLTPLPEGEEAEPAIKFVSCGDAQVVLQENDKIIAKWIFGVSEIEDALLCGWIKLLQIGR